jgi:D-alanyl-D-alanine carboxypeptidase/D-alanyl-D-alanine-endopeptidase (penicillin-binding protein 4)
VGFGHRIGHTVRVPGRGLHRVVTVLVVIMTAGALGGAVALSTPSLLAAMHPTAAADTEPALPTLKLGPLSPTAPLPTETGLAAVLGASTAKFPGQFTGVVLDPASNKVLWQQTPDTPLVPGSTAKLLTTSAALLTLNPTSSLVTRVVAGTEPGSVVLVGGGDPTLTALPAGQNGVYPDPARLTDLAAQVKAATGGAVTKVVIDTSRYRGPTLAPGWDSRDIAGGDITPITPLMLDGGRVDPTQQDGARVTDPAQEAGLAFAKLLGLGKSAVVEGVAVPNAKALGSVISAPIADLVEHLLSTSDNVLAEVLARETAIARGGEPSFDGAVEAMTAALTQAGIPTTGMTMVDGSGLSTQDKVPAQLLGALLAAAAAPAQGPDDTEFLRPVLTGLPVAGGDGGTLEDRFTPGGDSSAGRGVVRAKTGTLTAASSLAGVVVDADQRLLVFAFMSNGALPFRARPRLDDLAAGLSRCGCR